jgi:NADPH:quinone reductase-like Zn-dependent oxidoreductase
VSEYKPGDAVFGVTNPRFTGGYAEYAVAPASMIAKQSRAASALAQAVHNDLHADIVTALAFVDAALHVGAAGLSHLIILD